MLFRKRLKGLHVAVLATDGFEQVELTIPAKALRAEGARVEVLSLRRGKIRGLHLYSPGRTVRVDRAPGVVPAVMGQGSPRPDKPGNTRAKVTGEMAAVAPRERDRVPNEARADTRRTARQQGGGPRRHAPRPAVRR